MYPLWHWMKQIGGSFHEQFYSWGSTAACSFSCQIARICAFGHTPRSTIAKLFSDKLPFHGSVPRNSAFNQVCTAQTVSWDNLKETIWLRLALAFFEGVAENPGSSLTGNGSLACKVSPVSSPVKFALKRTWHERSSSRSQLLWKSLDSSLEISEMSVSKPEMPWPYKIASLCIQKKDSGKQQMDLLVLNRNTLE